MEKLVITKDYQGIVDDGYRYKLNGNLISATSIDIQLDKGLYVQGFIEADGSINAGGYIDAGGYIEAGWSINAGGYIEAGWSINADGSIAAGEGILAQLAITCKSTLKAKFGIYAGVCTWKEPSADEQTITCGKLDGTVKYGTLKLIEVA